MKRSGGHLAEVAIREAIASHKRLRRLDPAKAAKLIASRMREEHWSLDEVLSKLKSEADWFIHPDRLPWPAGVHGTPYGMGPV